MIDPILITGCARSGTSLTAGIIHLAGAWGGKMSGSTDSNEKGMFENEVIKDKIIKPYLKSTGADPMGQNPLVTFKQLVATPAFNLRKDVLAAIKAQGYKNGPWFYKCAKSAHLWTQWEKHFPNAKWIIVRRVKNEIINSCLNAPFMRAYKTAEGWSEWVDSHSRQFWEMADSMKGRVIEVWPEKLINGDPSEMKAMVKALGLKWNEKKICEFVSPELWHVR